MRSFIVLAIVGLLAQLVDGSLGMAYGVTSTTLLLAVGISPARATPSAPTTALPAGVFLAYPTLLAVQPAPAPPMASG
jgi:uncharacterized membrane protein YfcA